MAAPVVSMVLNQLGTFFREEIQKEVRMVVSAKKEVQKLVLGAKEEIEKLEVTLTAIQAVLYDADKKQVQDQRVKLWLERLTEVVYEIEDILDNWNTKIIQSKIRNQNSPGSIEISGLWRVKSANEAKEVHLVNIEEENDDATSSINKEKLVVFPNLIKLHIMDMSELEEWVLPFERSDTLQIMPRLRSLTICRATKLKVLPALGRLESLEELTLISLDSLLKRRGPEFFGISEDDVTKGTSGSSRGGESLPIIVLPKLKTLYFFMMEEWEEWKMMMPSWRQDVSFIMPCLKELTLDTCPKLKVVPRNIFSYQPVKERIVDCPELNQLSGMNQIISRREVGESAGKIELYRQSNVLMLGREEIDVLWDYKDQLPKEIKAEVLFPINEEFYEVEEIFSNVDEKVDSDGKEIFCYEYLKMATNNFQDKLGSGGSGSVFKGILKDGTQVAVKRVLHVTLGEQMLSTLANVKHVHLVTLRGYCIHMMGMVRDFYIVYDLLPNGSLDDWIFSSTGDPTGRYLSWKSRYTIAVDVAEALAYLHHDCCPQILHLDVKPANILLDNNFRGVLSDFGFSRLMENDMGTVFSSIIGTTGYIDPGWKYGISVKCDIYSYGKVLMDIFFGKPDVCLNLEGIDMYKRHSEGGNSEREQRIFHAFMWKTLRQGKIMDLFDKRLVENEGVDEREAICLVYAALSCLQDEHELRPHDMREVIDILNQKIQKGTELSRLLELGSTT
ncbi:hypothetical protein GIB67_002492 [Kingdonia uniflora]|uniref:Protein kinase domain-containing protein n=1 Tax=Kingdonia uniflora TaxID=39325 RepID=A0A7J7LAL4_9MAGN|nr:hypothetical protein GIB67_002492 [Kingdonia uniflora]